MTLLQNTAEGGTAGVAVTTANSGGSSGTAFSAIAAGVTGGISFSAAHVRHGSLAYYMSVSTAAAAACTIDWNDTAASTFTTRFYLYLTSYPSATIQGPVGIRSAANASIGRLNMSATGQLQVVLGTANTTSTLTTATLALNTWYRVEVYGSGMGTASASMTCDVYAGDATGTPYLTTGLTGQNTTATVGIVRYGKINTAGSCDWYVDELGQNIGSSTPLGPSGPLTIVLDDPAGGYDSGASVVVGETMTDGAGATDDVTGSLSGTGGQIADAALPVHATASAVPGAVVSPDPVWLGRNTVALSGGTTLLVQIGHGVASRAVTVPAPTDLTMAWSVPGGDDTCSFTLDWPAPALARPDCLTQGMPLRVLDRRTGEIQWQGRVVDPGPNQAGGARSFKVNAVGMRADLERLATLKNYIDRDSANWRPLFTWKQGPMTIADGSLFASYNADALNMTPTWAIEFPQPQGSTVNTGAVGGASYLVGQGATLGLPAEAPRLFYLAWSILSDVAASTDAEILLGTYGSGTITLYDLAAWPTTQTNNAAEKNVGAWTAPDATYWTVRWERKGGTVTQPVDHYLQFANLITVGERVNRYGVVSNLAHGAAGASITTVLCSDIVEDLVGSLLAGQFVAGTIAGDFNILVDQACWYRGVSAREVLDHVQGYDPDGYWAVWAAATPDGLPRVDWRKYGTTPRYVLPQASDYSLAGGADLWANSALVAWERGNGVPQTTRATVTVPAISRLFPTRTRDITLDLSDRGVMDGPTARTFGYAALAQLSVDRNSGTATVAGPIMDDGVGRMVQPWEIRPGCPVRVAATPQQYTDGLPLAYDGETTFRLTQVTYSASSNTAELSLDGGSRTLFKAPPKPKKPGAVHPKRG